MATLNNLPFVDPNIDDPLVKFTTAQSALKMAQLNTIMFQRFGKNWKTMIMYAGLFLFGVIVLLVVGISTENPGLYNILGHFKTMCMAALLAGAISLVWVTLKPYKDKKVYGVVPYPTVREMIPPDSSQCGRAPMKCDPLIPAKQCNKICVQPDDVSSSGGKKISNNYECVQPNHPNVFYLGTKLDPNENYCLPKQSKAVIDQCSKKNGKILWTLKPDGTQGWECQCLYPDIFGGPKCDQQKVCNYVGNGERHEGTVKLGQGRLVDNLASILKNNPDKYGRPTYDNKIEKNITNEKTGQVSKLYIPAVYWDTWDNATFLPPSLSMNPPSSPYEMMADPRYPNDPTKKIPRFSCYCPGGYNTYDGDPYVCHSDICLNGGSYGRPQASEVGFFDKKTNQCKCDPDKMVKTNVNGSCYTIANQPTCMPHLETQYCTYGWTLMTDQVYSTQDLRSVARANSDNLFRLMIAINVDKNTNNMTSVDANTTNITKAYLCADRYYLNPTDILNCFVDVTPIVSGNNTLIPKFYDLTLKDKEHKNVLYWLFDTLVAFPIKGMNQGVSLFTQFTTTLLTSFRGTDLDMINTLAGNDPNKTLPKGVAKACNSFYFRRQGIDIKDDSRCEDPLSKTGSDFFPICDTGNSCGTSVKCIIDLSRNGVKGETDPRFLGWGYHCQCQGSNDLVSKFNGISCGVAVKKGKLIPNLWNGTKYEKEWRPLFKSLYPPDKKDWPETKTKEYWTFYDFKDKKIGDYKYNEWGKAFNSDTKFIHLNPLCEEGYQTSLYEYMGYDNWGHTNEGPGLRARYSKCGLYTFDGIYEKT